MAMAVVGIVYSIVTFNCLTLIEWARGGKHVLWTFCGDRDRQCHSHDIPCKCQSERKVCSLTTRKAVYFLTQFKNLGNIYVKTHKM